MPAGVPLTEDFINTQLARRQVGYGRGGRMRIERDTVRVTSGVRFGKTLGSPIALTIENRDWANWTDRMAQFAEPDVPVPPITMPRPGHADLAGMVKYETADLRDILERASARETAARVAAGAVARALLEALGVQVFSHVLSIGGVRAQPALGPWARVAELAEASDVHCADAEAAERMRQQIDRAREAGDTLGGVVQVVALGLPAGLGSHVHADRRLDGVLAGALMSIPAIKGVEFGLGFGVADRPGSEVHDAMAPDGTGGVTRWTNHAGGLEGGMTNGEPLLVQIAMKPIPTLMRALPSVDVATGGAMDAHAERSDVCAVPAAGVVAEAMVSLTLGSSILSEFCRATLREVRLDYARRVARTRAVLAEGAGPWHT
jgi:chorismate synthase